jgi:hypothetical protein
MTRITEPYWTSDGRVAFNDLFAFEHVGEDAAGHALGEFRAVGTTRFRERFRRLAIHLPETVDGTPGSS